MSHVKNQNLRFWQDVVAKLRCSSIVLEQNRPLPLEVRDRDIHFTLYPCASRVVADPQQQEIIADGYALMLMVWSDLVSSPLRSPHLRNLTRILVTNPVADVVACLKDADQLLLEIIQEEEICSFDDFKHRLCHASELKGLLSPFAQIWRELQVAGDRSLAVYRLHTGFSFIGRLNIPNNDRLVKEAEKRFIEQEELLADHFVYTTREAQICSRWFPNSIETYEKLYGGWVPSHGNGSVADSELNLLDKYLALGVDGDTDYLDLLTGGPSLPFARGSFERISKVVFVPKSVDKLRTICMEPATLMFYQQGFMDTLVRYIHSHKYLKRRINLADATLNTGLACKGSIDGNLVTIDLSNASDSVSWRLVQQWFTDTPLMPILTHTRSHEYKLGKRKERRSYKFAPMGSALCFPVECLVFAAICEATIRESGGDPYCSDYRVYGDDIIIERKYAHFLIQRLRANGFSVNQRKSFFSLKPHNFRESCGGEYLDGYDVTPLRIPRKFSGFSIGRSASSLEALRDLANSCFEHGLATPRQFLISEILKLKRCYQPFFCLEGNGGILSNSATNFHLQRKYSHNYQRFLLRHGRRKGLRGYCEDGSEHIRLYEWLRSHSKRSLDSELSESRTFLLFRPTVRSVESDLLIGTWT